MTAIPTATVDYQFEKGAVRLGHCPEHTGTTSVRFVGVVARGWVFKCWQHGGHYFVNEPPPSER